MKSIRSHLTKWLLPGMAGLCVAGGWLAYRTIDQTLQDEFDYSLRTKIINFARLSEMERSQYEFEFEDQHLPEFERKENPEYFQIVHPDGTVITRSLSLGDAVLPLPGSSLSAEPHLYDIPLPGGVQGRAAAVEVVLDDSEIPTAKDTVIILIARDTLHLNQVSRRLAITFTLGTFILSALVMAAVCFIVQSGLKPLDALAEQAAAIRPNELDKRFLDAELPEELRPIADQLNQLLQRMESAFQRERNITAGMAHELYTPIAELRAAMDVALKWPDEPGAFAAATKQAHEIALQMQEIVDALLALSRCEAGMQELNPEPLNIAGLLDAICRPLELKLQARQIQLIRHLPVDTTVLTDRSMLTVILHNLFNNASAYTPDGGIITCELKTTDQGIELILSNAQEGLREDDLPHLFEPLWRKDTSRTGPAHSGLGLTIVERFSRLLGVGLAADLPEPDRFRLTLTFHTAS